MSIRQPSCQTSVQFPIHAALLVYFESALQKETTMTRTPFVLQRLFFNRLLPCGREDSISIGFIPAEMSQACKKSLQGNRETFAVRGVHNPPRPYAVRKAARLSEWRRPNARPASVEARTFKSVKPYRNVRLSRQRGRTNQAASLHTHNDSSGLPQLSSRLRIHIHVSNLEGRVHPYFVCGGAPA